MGGVKGTGTSTQIYNILKIQEIQFEMSEAGASLQMQKLHLKQILSRHLELGWAQEQIVAYCKEMGHPITQSTLSRMESGAKNIKSESYQKAFNVLGGIKDLKIVTGNVPKFEQDFFGSRRKF